MGELERNRLAVESELAPNVRLSCQIRIEQDLKVRVINQVSVRGMDAGQGPWIDMKTKPIVARNCVPGVIFARNSSHNLHRRFLPVLHEQDR
jgi:hypothetical protein